ncbi:aspartate carbamoyltransferase catalytic subunit [Singulisphaera sp. PoT]|uniref:aspartate carbamoyltransferase catalytic subunit n=1 Tax=Singulisphaera sp. PoT TaxID=3411797 RepID=UPI003BF589A4
MEPQAASTNPVAWSRKHLLGLEDLSKAEITGILDTADSFLEVSSRSRKKVPTLQGRVVFNLFFENSTRTRTSFDLAAKRLSADTQDFSASVSSLSKGETFIDTARNIEAMGADVMVVRHPTPGAPHLLAQHVQSSIINAGDGAHEHPTQGLLDLMTIRRKKGKVEGLTVGIVGDISHSRVARSNIWGLLKLGARVILCGPPTLVPRSMERLGCEVAHHLDQILPQCDVVNVLRIQLERQQKALFPSIAEYSQLYGMTQERVRRGKDDLLVLAPGPINRGVELTPEVADGPNSAILDQVTNGLAVRMAVLYLLSGRMNARRSTTEEILGDMAATK